MGEGIKWVSEPTGGQDDGIKLFSYNSPTVAWGRLAGMESCAPLGDQGILARFHDETSALRWAEAVRLLDAPWLLDVVQAYSTVAVFHDPDRIRQSDVLARLAGLHVASDPAGATGRLHHIPCCYELNLDLERIARATGLSTERIIVLHAGHLYTVYAIGFCPGFPYLGYLPPELCGVPRLETPRLRVEPGSVGLTGRQTGIYTEARPGGWNIVGRTPLVLVDVADGYFPLRTGDRVCFERIDEKAFRQLHGERL
jgi:inhibitor of KinA